MTAVGRVSVNLIEHSVYIDWIVVFGSHLLANGVAAATLMPNSMKMLCANANVLLSSTKASCLLQHALCFNVVLSPH